MSDRQQFCGRETASLDVIDDPLPGRTLNSAVDISSGMSKDLRRCKVGVSVCTPDVGQMDVLVLDRKTS
jgi:hypothetical protein